METPTKNVEVVKRRYRKSAQPQAEPQKRKRTKKTVAPIEQETMEPKRRRGRRTTVDYVKSSTPVKVDENIILHINSTIEEPLKIYDENTNNNASLEELYKEHINQRKTQDNDTLNALNINNDIVIKTSFDVDAQKDNRKRGFMKLYYNHADIWDGRDVCCWWCCHTFDTVPIGVPIEYRKKIEKFRIKGLFCSFHCMIAYKCNDPKLSKTNMELVNMLYHKLTGCFIDKIKPAPPRESLMMFGGCLSIEEYRKNFKEDDVLKMVEYPMFISSDYVESVDIKNIKTVNSTVFKNQTNHSKIERIDSFLDKFSNL